MVIRKTCFIFLRHWVSFSSVHRRSWIFIFFAFSFFLFHITVVIWDLYKQHLVCMILFSILAAMYSACLELACTKQLNSGTCSAAICFSKTIFDLVLEASNFVFQRDSKPWQLSGVVCYQRLWSYLYNWNVSENPFFMLLQTRWVGMLSPVYWYLWLLASWLFVTDTRRRSVPSTCRHSPRFLRNISVHQIVGFWS